MMKAIIEWNKGKGAEYCSDCKKLIRVGFIMTDDEREALSGKKDLSPNFCTSCDIVHGKK